MHGRKAYGVSLGVRTAKNGCSVSMFEGNTYLHAANDTLSLCGC